MGNHGNSHKHSCFSWQEPLMIVTYLSRTFRKRVFMNCMFERTLSKALSSLTLGRLVFRISIFMKRIESYFGFFNPRIVEYQWILKQLPKESCLVLDVGCSESFLSHELLGRGYVVVGLDIRECPWRNDRVHLIKRDVSDTRLQREIFPLIVIVSTIEHIGLNAYGQLLLDNDGDIKAMRELYRILKSGGKLLLTTPYIGEGPLRIVSRPGEAERRYNVKRLQRLIDHFVVLKQEYFFPVLKKGLFTKRYYFQKLPKKTASSYESNETGIACLVLKKP